METATHLTCGRVVLPRWILSDDGDAVIVFWCAQCHDAPTAEELSRAITVDDVVVAVFLAACAADTVH